MVGLIDMASVPIKCGIFWDIENVRVPKGELATDIVKSIRKLVVSKSWLEVDFYVACDVYNQSSGLMRSLDLSGLCIVHVSNAKNGADEKLKNLMIRFVDENSSKEIAIVLLTGDFDFGPVLRGFKRRHNVTIYLIYGESASQSLVDCVDKSFHISTFVMKNGNKPRPSTRPLTPLSWDPWLVQVTGYPLHIRNAELVAEFKNKAHKHHGKFAEIQRGTVWLSFTNKSDAIKTRDELNGRTFKGGKLKVNVTESRLLVNPDRPTVNQLALQMDQKSPSGRSRQVSSSESNPPTIFYPDEKTIHRTSSAMSLSDHNSCCTIS